MRHLKPLLAIVLLAAPILAQAQLTERQVKLLANNCLQCHARGTPGVPSIGDADEWKMRVKDGEDAMLRKVIEGWRGMPPFGYCSACDEADLRALTRQIAGLPGRK